MATKILLRGSSVVVCLLAVVLALLMPIAARAQLTLDLTTPVQSGLAGSTITFTGTLTNTSGATLFLNELDFNFIDPAGTYLQNNDPVNLYPDSLAPNETYDGDLFTLDISSSTPNNSVLNGNVVFLGGATTSDLTPLASQNFQVNVTGTGGIAPEPGSCSLLAFAGLAAVLPVCRQRRKK